MDYRLRWNDTKEINLMRCIWFRPIIGLELSPSLCCTKVFIIAWEKYAEASLREDDNDGGAVVVVTGIVECGLQVHCQ